ncbi:MAG: transposase [Pleurocapsa sp. MO_226.B13]|nr:transposase [Pleurocapsa sp. MO_226.B13]
MPQNNYNQERQDFKQFRGALDGSNENLPWSNHWSVLVVDSDYSAKTFLREQSQHPNLVVVTRVRSDRVFYQSPEPRSNPSKGHPQWYGAKFDERPRVGERRKGTRSS